MPPSMIENLIYAKTPAAEAEIKSRDLKLAPRLRSTLILVDGKRASSGYVALLGADIQAVLAQLQDLGLIHAVDNAASPSPVAAPVVAVEGAAQPPAAGGTMAGDIAADLQRLPAAATRSAKDVEMSRHFMTNTVNLIFGQNMRLTLVRSIFDCRSAEDLRGVYPRWFQAMADDRSGAKRLAEWRGKLSATL